MSDIDYGRIPRLELRHANARGTGSALRLRLVTASQEREGHIHVSLAKQFEQTGFDWANSVCADLGAVDLAKLLMVFTGWTEGTVKDGSGDNTVRLVQDDGSVVTVDLRHRVDPGPHYVLTATRYVLHVTSVQAQIELSNAESVAIAEAIRGAMHRVAFGDTVLCMGVDLAGEAK